ncbi:MAG TPA: hypothetical protein VI461_03185 [Chitinophagaceae bacterium]|nr:hypothetical protein [Chitinophagaceae bacterium]
MMRVCIIIGLSVGCVATRNPAIIYGHERRQRINTIDAITIF